MTTQEAAIQIMKIIHDNDLSIIMLIQGKKNEPLASHVCLDITPLAIIECCAACDRHMVKKTKPKDKLNLN